MEDLRRVLLKAQDAKVIHSLVIKEKRATFLPSPGLEAFVQMHEQNMITSFLPAIGLRLAYPATIEGAVMSGKKAAELAG